MSFSTLERDLEEKDWEDISYAGAIVFTPQGKIISIQQERGLDIPGGHREDGESPLETMKRELEEELGLKDISNFSVILTRQSNIPYKGIKKPLMVYFIVYNIEQDLAFSQFLQRDPRFSDEVSEIVVLDPEEFIDRYMQRGQNIFTENICLAVREANTYFRKNILQIQDK